MAEPVRRLFFALWPTADVAAALHVAAKAAHKSCGGRVMRRESLHLTLAFLGEIVASRVTLAEEIAAGITAEPFTLVLDRIACWKHNRIVWAGCSDMPPALPALADGLGKQLRTAGFSLDKRPFAAHATLVRNGDCRAPLPALTPIAWPVSEFVLVESTLQPVGSQYEIVSRWPFALH